MNEHLNQATGRRLLHKRQVTCSGYLRDDGLIDVEGHLLDIKTDDVEDVYRTIHAGEPFHRMHVVLTVDSDFVIQQARAITRAGPTPACRGAAAAYAELVGLKVGPGFNKLAAERLGRGNGCTHLTELLGPMATTLYQTTIPLQVAAQRQRVLADPHYEPARPFVIGTCHAYSEGGEAAQILENRWRQWRPAAGTIANE